MPPVAGSPPFHAAGPIAPPALAGAPPETSKPAAALPGLAQDPADATAPAAVPPALAEGPADATAPTAVPPALADGSAGRSAPATVWPAPAAAPSAPSKPGSGKSGGPPWRAGPPTPAEFAAANPEFARKSGPASPRTDDGDADAAEARSVAEFDVGVDTDPLNKIVSGGHGSDDTAASDVPDVELSDTEVAEVLSGRVIPIGAFFGASQASSAGTADQETAGVAGDSFLADASRLVANWAADRYLGITSTAGIGIALAACAAAWFSAGTRADIIRGVVALWAGYLVLRTGSWLAGQAYRASAGQPATDADGAAADMTTAGTGPRDAGGQDHRRSRRHGRPSAELRRPGPVGWLAALGAAVAESGVYAGLAAGAVAERWGAVWTLATAVLSLVAVRNLMTACSTPPGLSEQAGGAFRRLCAAVLTMPVGGRVLLVGVVAPFWGARTALLALLDWAIISLGYGIAGRAAAGITGKAGESGQPGRVAARSKLVRLRDDGAIARTLGVLVKGNLMPLPPALLGLAAVSGLAFVGLHGLPGVLLIAPAVVMLLAAPGSANPHTGRFDWLVPVLLLGAQCLYLTATGLAVHVPGPVIFALIAAIMLRYTDLAWPGRPIQLVRRRDPDAEPAERGTALGWDGRMLFAGLTAAMGVATVAYVVLAAYLVALVCAKAVTACFAPSAEARPRIDG